MTGSLAMKSLTGDITNFHRSEKREIAAVSADGYTVTLIEALEHRHIAEDRAECELGAGLAILSVNKPVSKTVTATKPEATSLAPSFSFIKLLMPRSNSSRWLMREKSCRSSIQFGSISNSFPHTW